jgi:hypothetical protein
MHLLWQYKSEMFLSIYAFQEKIAIFIKKKHQFRLKFMFVVWHIRRILQERSRVFCEYQDKQQLLILNVPLKLVKNVISQFIFFSSDFHMLGYQFFFNWKFRKSSAYSYNEMKAS